MKATFLSLLFIALLFATEANAQMQLSNFYPHTASYQDTVYLVGNGFGDVESDILVLLGKAEAEIASISDQSIKVLVPNTASIGPVTVTKLSTNKILYTPVPFIPVFKSSGFDFSHLDNASKVISEEEGLYDLCHCDFDQDGDQDIATTNNADAANQTSVNVFGNTTTDPSSVSFARVPGTYFNINQPARNISCGDLDGDGKPELIVSQGGNAAENIYVFKNTSSTSPAVINFNSPIILNTNNGGQTNGTRRLSIHDLDGDNLPEIIVSNQTAQQLIIFKNQSSAGSLNFPSSKRKFVAVPASTLGLSVNDMDGDEKADIVLSSNLSTDFYILRNTSNENALDFADPQSFSLSGQLANLSTGDIDGDGKQDLVLTDFEDGAILLLLNQSTSNNMAFASPIRMNAALQPWGVTLADISGNQKADIVVATLANSDKIVVLKNNSTPGDPNFELIPAGFSTKYRNLAVAEINGDGKPDIVVTEQDAFGNFHITYIQNNSCIHPEIFPADPQAICEANPVLLSATSVLNATYQWAKDGAVIAGATQDTYLASTSGDYTVEISDTDIGCSSLSEAVSVVEDAGSIPSVPPISAPSIICEGETLTLSTTSDPSLTYLWTGPNGFSSTELSPQITNISSANAGTYLLEVKQGLCKSATRSVFVQVVETDEIEVMANASTTLCPGDDVTLEFDATGLSNIQWYRDDQPIPGETSNSLTTSRSGVYSIQAENATSCTLGSTEVNVQLLTFESGFTLNDNEVCTLESITLASESIIPSQSNVTYLWDFGDGTQSPEATPSHRYTEPGTYNLSLTLSLDAGVCSSTSTQRLTVTSLPEAEIVSSADYLCPGDTISLDIRGDLSAVVWEDSSQRNLRFISEAGTYSATVFNTQGCDSIYSITIEQITPPEVNVEVIGDTQIIRGDSVQLLASGADYYEWSPTTSLSDATVANPYAQPIATTTYRVTSYETNGCATTEEITISVDIGQIQLEALDIFSPNGDGTDDTWVVNNIDLYPDCYFVVFDLNGQQVFRSQMPYQNDWAGFGNNGIPLPAGSYYYVVRCQDRQNKGSGSVTILR